MQMIEKLELLLTFIMTVIAIWQFYRAEHYKNLYNITNNANINNGIIKGIDIGSTTNNAGRDINNANGDININND